jgi:uncharacterized protein YdaU (DUF1376 family)
MPQKWQKWMPLDIDQFWSSPSVQRMSDSGKIGYLALICAQWHSDDGSLSCDMDELAIASRLSDEAWEVNSAAILRKFTSVVGNRIRNEACFQKWLDAKTIFEARQASAKRTNTVTARSPHGHRTIRKRSPVRSADTRTDTETSTETEEQKLKASPLSEKSDGTPPAEFANAWNRLKGPLPRVTQFTESRRKKIIARQRQGISLEEFEKAVKVCARTPFLLGDSKQGWVASFDWLVENDTNIVKVLEGKYEAGESNGTSKSSNGSNGTRGAAVGRVERGQSAFRAAAIASVEAAGGFDAGSDDGGIPESGAPPGHSADVPARSGDASGGVRDPASADGSGIFPDAPEILPPSQRNTGGSGSHGSQRAH